MKKSELFMRTVSKVQFYPFDPLPGEIYIQDIARGLSNMCRFSGQVRRFYSVAQHSVHVSKICRPQSAMWGLLHDASEAYLSDVVSPLKKGLPEYRKVEKNVMLQVCKRFGLSTKMPESVLRADNRAYFCEEWELRDMSYPSPSVNDLEREFELMQAPMSPDSAYKAFMSRYDELAYGGS
jgi:5'-deoxynucleotidase YfbR-like HD superfamily hydrolase